MPEYLAPGVFVEETSFRAKSIEGVSTTTTGFIGPTRYGPTDLEPEVVTSLVEFERMYGDRQQLQFRDPGAPPMHNYVWHAVRAFFEEGGKRCYIARTFEPDPAAGLGFARATVPLEPAPGPGTAPSDPPERRFPNALHVRARFPGSAGSLRVRFTLRRGPNILSAVRDPRTGAITPVLGALLDYDVVWIADLTSPIESPPGQGGRFYVAKSRFNPTTQTVEWVFKENGATFADADFAESATRRSEGRLFPSDLVFGQPVPGSPPGVANDELRVVTLTVSVFPDDPEGLPSVWSDLPLDPRHERSSSPDSVFAYFDAHPSNLTQARSLPLVVARGPILTAGNAVLDVLAPAGSALRNAVMDDQATDAQRSLDLVLTGGNDGVRPVAGTYDGAVDDQSGRKTGLKQLEDLEDVSIVAAPGATYGLENGYRDDGTAIMRSLISHAERMKYRIAVLDSGDGQSITSVRGLRGTLDSKYAALYYPWVRVLDPVTRREIELPPSGFVAGIYARNDAQRAVYKAPANEVVNLALGFERTINQAQQEVLNPEGINCFRFFEGRGFRLWGARTVSSDPEWKYVNLRRYFIYLEHSIDRGTQWAVFEPNGEALWANVRRTVEDFMFNEWMNGALLGDRPEKAYFVRCDRSTMTQNDLDNGRLVCLIGVAALRPAEFVIFRIGQWTGDRRN